VDIKDQVKKLKDTYGEEDLHDDLKYYIQSSETLGQILHHPLVVQVPYFPALNKMINQQYKHKKNSIEKSFESGEWDSYIFMHERPYRMDAFNDIKDDLNNEEYWSTLKTIFVDSENISQNHSDWDELLDCERDGKEHFMDKSDKESFNKLPDDLIIYRGFKDENGENGFSWTLSVEKAIWFADRFGNSDNSYVASATVNKNNIIGYTDSRNEDEIIVTPENIRILKIVNSSQTNLFDDIPVKISSPVKKKLNI
jgi:hypothetical protein